MSERLLAFALLASCVRAPPEARRARTAPVATLAASVPEPVTAGPVARTEPRSARLQFELNGRAFPLPLVHGTVSGEPVWMLVDTGANSHVIASWVAHKVGMALQALGPVGSDHTGRAVTASAAAQPRVAIDEWGTLADGPMLVTDIPPAIAGIGIGAFVSPQSLAAEGEGVVLDLARREMRLARWDDAAEGLEGAAGAPIAPEGARLCKDDTSVIKGLAFVLPASIDGRKVELLLDTGAHRTDLFTTSRAGELLAGRSLPSREQMYSASGLVRTRLVRAAHVRLGAWAMTADIDLVPGAPDPACARDGAISMDVLASCTLLLGRRAMLGRCGP